MLVLDNWKEIFNHLQTKELLRICQVCKAFTQIIFDLKIKTPYQFLIKQNDYISSEGNLLSWLVVELEEDFNEIVQIDIFKNNILCSYVFNMVDFDIYFHAKYGEIKEIEKLYRFVLADGASYNIEHSDNEYYPTYLKYIDPVVKKELLNGLIIK